MANTSTIRQQAAHTTNQLAFPSSAQHETYKTKTKTNKLTLNEKVFEKCSA